MDKKISLNGDKLKAQDVYDFVHDSSFLVEIEPKSLVKVSESRAFVEDNAKKQIIYGVNTGFGPMASYIISSEKLDQLQINLIRSHAVGMGEPIEERYVLAAMLIRLNTIIKGYSGVSVELVKRLQLFINKRIVPIVPEHGAVGTSGDLVQLAHIALALIGEGEVSYKGKRQKTSIVLKKLGIPISYKLGVKEGLALINGTSVMSGIASILLVEVEKIIDIAVHNAAFAFELAHVFTDAISSDLHAVRPQKGQIEIARRLRKILKDSGFLSIRPVFTKNQQISRDTHNINHDVQQFYSLRCTPQILGPVLDSWIHAKNIISTEINSVTDNPVVDWEKGNFLHGGNFHGDYIAYAIDQLKMTVVKLTMLSERRINFFLHSKINERFTPFLNLNTPGLTLALQGLQFVATSTTAQSQTLAFPQYVHSIPTNADNQDVVSMGTDAALLFAKVVENAFIVEAIELVTLCQALDVNNNKDKLASITKDIYKKVRSVFPAVTEDRVLSGQLNKLVYMIRYNK